VRETSKPWRENRLVAERRLRLGSKRRSGDGELMRTKPLRCGNYPGNAPRRQGFDVAKLTLVSMNGSIELS